MAGVARHKGRCKRCGTDMTKFPRDKRGRLRTVCDACKRPVQAGGRYNPEVHRRSQLKTKYGMTPEDYDRMVAAQGGRCAICGEEPPGDIHQRSLHIDHDHLTGQVRGLLCSACNTGLGKFRDSPRMLLAAIGYLEAHP